MGALEGAAVGYYVTLKRPCGAACGAAAGAFCFIFYVSCCFFYLENLKICLSFFLTSLFFLLLAVFVIDNVFSL